MKFLDFFSGIGGFRLGMEMAGHECVGHCEIDKYANRSYIAMHQPKEDEWYAANIRDVEPGDLPEADCYCFGFPCQTFSIAGNRGGFEDTRGTLFFEVMRLAAVRKPKYLFAENVAGLLSHDGGRTFGTILSTLGELGYWWEYQVLNSKDFGVPQNRERVYIVGHLGERSGREVFPISGTNREAIKQISGGSQSERIYAAEGLSPCLDTMQGGNKQPKVMIVGNVNPSGNGMNGNVFNSEGLAPTLTTNKGEGNKIAVPDWIPTPDKINKTLRSSGRGSLSAKHNYDHVAIPVLTPDRVEKRQNGRRFKENGDPMFTLTAQDRHGVVVSIDMKSVNSSTRRGMFKEDYTGALDTNCNIGVTVYQKTFGGTVTKKINETGTLQAARLDKTPCIVRGFRIRKITPRECFRLQAFSDKHFERAAAVNSDSQLYKQAGNSVTVTVVYEIGKRLEY